MSRVVVTRQVKKMMRALAEEAMRNSERWMYWRRNGIIVADAPISYLDGKELDEYTDKLIKAEKEAKAKEQVG